MMQEGMTRKRVETKGGGSESRTDRGIGGPVGGCNLDGCNLY